MNIISKKLLEKMIKEELILKVSNLSQKDLVENNINEGFLDAIRNFGDSFLGSGIMDPFIEHFADGILSSLGIADGIFKKALVNLIGNARPTEIKLLMSSSPDVKAVKCQIIATMVLKALQETLAEEVLFKALGITKDGMMGKALTEGLSKAINDVTNPLTRSISSMICNLSFIDDLGSASFLSSSSTKTTKPEPGDSAEVPTIV